MDVYKNLDSHTKSLLNLMNLDREYEIKYRGFSFKIFPGVFPPPPSFSGINGIPNSFYEKYSGKSVLEIGSGCGVRSIFASLAGANSVLGVDKYGICVKNSDFNARRYNCSNIKFIRSDLFENVKDSYDIIIDYLPYINILGTNKWIEDSVIDFELELQKKFLKNVSNHMYENSFIETMHGSNGNLNEFEDLIKKEGFSWTCTSRYHIEDIEWKFYRVYKK